MRNLLFFCLFTGVFFSCFPETEEKKWTTKHPYSFSSPERVYNLPEELKEISDILFINDSSIAGIQDEEGKIYFYNLKSEKIETDIHFGKKGDYEGMAKTEDAFFILRSDGSLFRYADSTVKYNTDLSEKDNTESLAYDKKNNRLIIGSKDGQKSFYAFDLNTLDFQKKPLFSVPENISPTEIDIHPITKDFYVLSKEKILVINKEGSIKDELYLKPSLFLQPEGMSFKQNGDLFISNEGNKFHTATILEFKYQPHEK